MGVSIKDIARKAGVKSHTTVSRALHDSPEISEETKRRIRAVAEELDYRPSAIARGLKTRRTGTIGVVVTALSDPFYADVVQGIELAAQDAGYSVLLSMSHEDPRREKLAVETLADRQVEGVIVASSRVGSRYTPLLQKLHIPIVLINSHQSGPYLYSIGIDNHHGGLTATAHLLRLGHQAIGYLSCARGGPPDAERRAGYQAALRAAGLRPDPRLTADGGGQVESAHAAALDLLQRAPRPTAIFCYNDMSALGALKAALELGLRVPDDLSLVGFDGLAQASYATPRLATFAQPRAQMGRLATQLVSEIISGSPQATQVILRGELVEGGSCRRVGPSLLPDDQRPTKMEDRG